MMYVLSSIINLRKSLKLSKEFIRPQSGICEYFTDLPVAHNSPVLKSYSNICLQHLRMTIYVTSFMVRIQEFKRFATYDDDVESQCCHLNLIKL